MKDSSFLWYDKPASVWTQALPIGNGTLGGMIYGKVEEETVSLNHDELWTGHPKNTIRPGSLEAFQKARALALDGKLRESQDIIESDFMEPGIPAPGRPRSDIRRLRPQVGLYPLARS